MTWRRISCEERDRLYADVPDLGVHSSCTDLDGEFGEPRVMTIWGTDEAGWLLQDERWPDDPDQGCEHCIWVPSPDEEDA